MDEALRCSELLTVLRLSRLSLPETGCTENVRQTKQLRLSKCLTENLFFPCCQMVGTISEDVVARSNRMTNDQRQKIDQMTDSIVQKMPCYDREVLNDSGAQQLGCRILQAVQPGLSVGEMRKRLGSFSAHRFFVGEVLSSDGTGLHGAELTLEVNRDKLLVAAWIRK
jgi:hypothetical protein